MKFQQPRVVPRVEALEARWVPAVTTTVSANGVLTVTGDAAPNSIVVIDNGTNVNGNVRVRVDGELRTFPTRTVATVRVLAGDGNDIVAYRLTGDLQAGPRPRNIIVNLGAGNNAFVGTGIGGLDDNAELSVFAFGLDGRDFIAWNSVADVGTGATLQFQAFGLGGIDSIQVSHTGLINGTANFNLNGGPGIDSVQATVNAQAGSTGQVVANARGQGDDDFLRLFVFGSAQVDVTASVDGGGGFNTAVTTANVTQINIQDGTVI